MKKIIMISIGIILLCILTLIIIPASIINWSDSGVITYNGYVYDCTSDRLDLRHNTWATQNDLLRMCKMCVLEKTYPIITDLRAQMLGDCEWWTSSTTGESRYRYRAIPIDSSSCNGAIDEITCYQQLVFTQLTSWSNDVNYCPNNPLAYINNNTLAACKQCEASTTKCDGVNSFNCIDFKWNNLGIIKGQCGVDCIDNQSKCIGTDYYQCTANKFVNKGKVIGQCEVSCVTDANCAADTFIDDNHCFDNSIIRTIKDYSCTSNKCSSGDVKKIIEVCNDKCSNAKCVSTFNYYIFYIIFAIIFAIILFIKFRKK